MTFQNTAWTLEDLLPPPEEKTSWPWIEQTNPLPDKMPDGSNWPRISIVTPSYNQGQFIEETIRSVLLQGYPNLEYIIIDGGSTDNTLEIIKKYSPWLDYWVSEKDRGQSDALNKGFAISTGEICAYINSDDIFLPNALSKVISAYTKNPEFRWIAFSVLCGESLTKNRLWQPYAAKFSYFVVNQTFAQPGVFWISDIQPKPWFDINRNINMDHKFFIENYLKFNAPLINLESIALFRIHNNSKTSQPSDLWEREHLTLFDEVSQLVDKATVSAIQREQIRLKYTSQIAELLSRKSEEISDKLVTLNEAIKIIVATPFVFRDRIFISGLTRLFLQLFQFKKNKVRSENE